MGCNNSNTLPEPINDIRHTISKIAPEKETSTEKKIAKSFKAFQEFIEELKSMLKEDGFYDYLFRAEYFEEMLQFITSTYVNHQETMKIISIVLQYMALTKNFINGRQILKTNFKIDTLASQLSARWTEIRAEVYFVNKNALKILNYLVKDKDERKSEFSHSYLNLNFDFSLNEAIEVALATKQLCKYEERAFFYFSNYLLKSCQNEYERARAVTVVEAQLIKALQEVSISLPKPNPLNGQQALFEHHKNFKANAFQNGVFSLDLGKIKPNERVKSLQAYIVQKAKASIQCFNKFNHLFQFFCQKNGCSHYLSQVRLKSRSQKKEILKIKQQCLEYHPFHKQSIEEISKNKTKDQSLQNIIAYQYELHHKDVDYFCQSFSGVAKFKIFDMLRSQCMFNDLIKLNQCCAELIKQTTKKGYKLIELSNKLRGGHGSPHILLRVLIGQTFCQFKLIFQYNLGEFFFSHFLSQMTKSQHLSALTKLHLFNEEITNSFLLEANQIIESNNKSKVQYDQRLTFTDLKSLFKQLLSILPFSLDQSKKAHNSVDFNLILDQIEQYKVIVQQFISDQVKIDRTDKIRRIAEYLFYEKKFDISEMLFSLYQKEIEENHAYLIEKIKNKSKEFIKSEVQLIDFYAESLQYLAKINKQKSDYSKAIEYYEKYLLLNNLVHQNKAQNINVMKKMAELHKLQKNYEQTKLMYHKCVQLLGPQDMPIVQIYHQIALACRKQAQWDEAIKYQTDSLHIIQKKLGKDCLQYSICLKHISELFKKIGKFGESRDWLEKSRQTYEKLRSRYTYEYSEMMRQLGFFQQKTDNLNKALQYYQQSLDIISKVEGDHLEECQKLYSRIGGLLIQAGNNQEALNKFKACLSLTKRIYGPQSIQHANILSSLGLGHQRLSQYKEALTCYQTSSQIKRAKLGEKHIQYIRTIINIGVIYDQQGQTQNALHKYQQSLSLLADSNQSQSSDQAILLNNIGLIEHSRGNYKKALQGFARALQIQEKIYGKDNKSYANTLSNIGLVKDDVCKYSQALEEYKQSLSIYEKLKDSKNQIAAAYNNIGTTLLHLSDFKQALKFYEKSLLLEESCRGNQSREYSMCLHCMGIVKFQQNHLDQAEKFYQHSKNILKKFQCLNSVEYSQILLSFGKLLLRRRIFDQSLVYFDEASNIIGAIDENNHIVIIEVLLNKGIAYFRLKRLDQSLQILQKGLNLCEKNHLKYRQYAAINYNIGLIEMQRQNFFSAVKYFKVALLLQQKFHDKNWKLTASKLAACSLLTQDEDKYNIYVSYLQEQACLAKDQRLHEKRKEKHS